MSPLRDARSNIRDKGASKEFLPLAKNSVCHYNHRLSIDATIMESKSCPIIGERTCYHYRNTKGYHTNGMTC